MSSSDNSKSNPETNESQLLRGALKPTIIVGALALVTCSILQGLAGFFGALLGQFVVVIYFLVRILVSKLSRNLDPISTMSLVMFSYVAKLFLLGVFLWALTSLTPRQTIDRTSFGVTAVVLTLAWLGGEMRSFLNLKTHLPLPPKQ
jgi:fructose-specific phosphotransferase system IIC component